MNDSPVLLSARQLTIRAGTRPLVANLDLSVRRGERIAVLGANGSGKTLTLATLAGLRPPAGGSIELGGTPIEHQSRRRIARQLSFLLQDRTAVLPETVTDSVAAGRFAHRGAFGAENAADRNAVSRAMRRMGIEALASRDVQTLSGGERQRVALARVMAQTAPLMLLDEPDNHLDLVHQCGVLDAFAAEDDYAVIASLHDLNLARRFATRFVLLFGDGDWVDGDAETALSGENLRRLTGLQIDTIRLDDGRALYVPPR